MQNTGGTLEYWLKKLEKKQDQEFSEDDETPYKGPDKIISGGQTGADRAGLEVARRLGIRTGGTCAPGYVTTSGKDISLSSFGVTPLLYSGSVSGGYVKRSMKNVDNADATIAFRTHSSLGTDKTIGYCVSGRWKKISIEMGPSGTWTDSANHPVIVIDISQTMSDFKAQDAIREFLKKHRVRVLNVAGHRERNGFQAKVVAFLFETLSEKWGY